jgi:hypothetical protein
MGLNQSFAREVAGPSIRTIIARPAVAALRPDNQALARLQGPFGFGLHRKLQLSLVGSDGVGRF